MTHDHFDDSWKADNPTIHMAPPERFEWVPTSSGWNPSFSYPRALMAVRIFVKNIDPGIVAPDLTKLISVSDEFRYPLIPVIFFSPSKMIKKLLYFNR